jgi:DNA-binding beta-propeller fold protein YncE
MRTAIGLFLLVSLLPACGDNDSLETSDAGSPDAEPPPPACLDPEPGIICTIAGKGSAGYSGDDGPALEAEFSLPQDVLRAETGELFVLDWNNHRLRKINTDGTIEHVAGRGELGGDLEDPAGQDFNHPTNVIFNQAGDGVLIAAWHNSKIRNIDIETGEVTDFAGDGRRTYFGDDGPAVTASFDLPAAIAWHPNGEDLVVMDQANQVLRYIDAEGDVHKLAGNCIIDQPVAAGGPGPCETPLACTNSEKMACNVNDTPTCSLPCNPGFATGDATELRMAQPFGQSADPAGRIAFDPDDNLLWVDTENSLIRKLDGDNNDSIVAGLPPEGGVKQKGYSGDNGPADEAKLNRPVDIAVAADGTIYFTDVFNHCVRKIDPDGIITTAVGVCEEKGDDGDGGAADQAHLKLPYGIELSDGTLYIADTGNQVIRAVILE